MDKIKNYGDNIKDFSQIDFTTIGTFKCPHGQHDSDIEFEDNIDPTYSLLYLDIDSIDKNAFIDLTNLTNLNLTPAKPLSIDLRNLSNLKEISIKVSSTDKSVGLNDLYLPSNLEKLNLFNFNFKLESLIPLKQLKFLYCFAISEFEVNDLKHFNCFKNLKVLSIKYCLFKFGKDYVEKKLKKEIRFDLENLEEMEIRFRDGFKVFFDNLPKVKRLHMDIDTNKIDLASIKTLSTLEDLSITSRFENFPHDTKLVDKEVFLNFHSLKKLVMKGNLNIDKNLFDHLVNLEYLALDHCYLDDIHLDTFANLNKLVYLSLCRNNLRFLNGDLFKNLKNLETLYMAYNPFLRIRSGLFRNLTKLKSLSLRQCSLFDIGVDTFSHLVDLEELDLAENQLMEIRAKTFDAFKGLKKLDLG